MMNSKENLLKELHSQGIHNAAVLKAIETVPREIFVPSHLQSLAYENEALPLSHEQTISQPYIVAKMTEIIVEHHPKKILEIGTGSGYQAAVLSQLVEKVYTVERIKPLLENAKEYFKNLGYTNIHAYYGDGNLGLPEHAPYDAIIVTAGSMEIPQALLDQLADKGHLLMPVGDVYKNQRLQLIARQGKKYLTTFFDYVRFVPLQKGTSEQ